MDDYGRRRSQVTSVLPDGDVPIYHDHEGLSKDEEVLNALGYKQEFRREFSLWTTFCVSFAVLGLLPSFASTLTYGMGYAGTGGMTWGWIVAMIFIQSVAMSMAELCSSMPTSGGLYYAAAVLAPDGWGPLAAWFTGWSNWIAQVTAAPSVDYAMAAMMLAMGTIENPDFVATNWQIFLLTTAIMIVHGFISSMPTKWIARFNSFGTTFNIIALCIVLVLIPAQAQRRPKFSPSKEVFGTIQNGTDWPDGIAVLMSFVGVIWTMSGYDSPFHLSEECSNANIASPRAIVMTSGIGGIFGWFLQLVVAYTVIDIAEVLDSDLGQPFAAYCLQVLPKRTAEACIALTIISAFAMGQACMVAASRVTYAYARDGCFPFSNIWKQVHPWTKTPVYAVWFNVVVGEACLLLIFAGEVAIGAIFSIGAIGAFVAFTTPIGLRVFVVGGKFRPGPWHLGKFGKPIGALAVSFVVLMTPILCFPSTRGANLTAADMNYTCAVYGGIMGFAMIYFAVDAHKWFKGPKVNIEHRMLGHDETVVEGLPDTKNQTSEGQHALNDSNEGSLNNNKETR